MAQPVIVSHSAGSFASFAAYLAANVVQNWRNDAKCEAARAALDKAQAHFAKARSDRAKIALHNAEKALTRERERITALVSAYLARECHTKWRDTPAV